MTTHAAHPVHRGTPLGDPEPAPHEAPECQDVPSDWLWTHNYICSCGEIVSESWWERHQAAHTANGHEPQAEDESKG